MLGEETVLGLAQWAGTTVAAAALTDAWEVVRGRITDFLGRGSSGKTRAVEGWLDKTHDQLAAKAPGTDLERAKTDAADRWKVRFEDLLDEDPALEQGLRDLLEGLAAQFPAAGVGLPAVDHSIDVGGDVSITTGDGGVAAMAIHGGVTLNDAGRPGRQTMAR